ncbi:glycoside hydrolase 5 family protein, partial [Cutibacterium acnes]
GGGDSGKRAKNPPPPKGGFPGGLPPDPPPPRRDFEGIAQLGLDHVRLFPLWPLLQPNRGLVRPRALDDVVSVVRAAGEFDLEVTVDALNGHLSSYDFLPPWVITWHTSNLFTDPLVKAGQTDLISQLATRLREEPNPTGMTVGNEFPQYPARAPGPHPPPPRGA